ncbi:MAG: amino acid adenylation domain-containing protein, partial [candidate division KSB1 bacterium]|nr:amino acid adenylation domain-containing protein [candidate division KSB1 bacterium]
HQNVPFEKVVDAVQPERDLSHSPLFQVMFVMQNNPRSDLKLKGLTFSAIELDTGISNFDLTLTMGATESGLAGALEYNTDLFRPSTIARMIEHFQLLLKALATAPDQPISLLSMMSAEELHRIIRDWNNTSADFPLDLCIHQLIEKRVRLTPEAVAVIGEGQQIAYQELNQRANQLARVLRKKGVVAESLVGLCVKRSINMIVGMLGILKAGAAYLPLDPDYPKERLEYMIQDSRVSLIITQQDLVNSIPGDRAELIDLELDWAKITEESDADLENVTHPLNQAYVIYTSGSTGKPKGVQVPHRSVVNHNLAVAELFGLQPSDRILQFATINFDTAVEEIFPALMSGAAIVLRPPDAVILSGEQLTHMIEQLQLTILDLPTAYWQEWVYELTLTKQELPASLRLVIVGGDKVAAEKYVIWKRMVGSNVRWLNTYGPTEGTVIAATYDPENETSPYQEGMEMPIGRPIANGKLHILDANLQPVPVGVPGELYIGGQCVARGYLNRPDLTAEKFIPDPFPVEPGARLYRTGDRARYLPDGNIEFLGRADYQVKIRGFRVELGEIETLLRQHPSVREAVVIAKEDSSGNKRLMAYCALTQAEAKIADERRGHSRIPFNAEVALTVGGNQSISVNITDLSETGARLLKASATWDWHSLENVQMKLKLPESPEILDINGHLIWQNEVECGVQFYDLGEEQQQRIRQAIAKATSHDPGSPGKILRDFLKEKLPDYMIPSVIMIVDEFPKTPSGKIDRNALPKIMTDGIAPNSESVTPRTPIEKKLADIWQEVLGIQRVGIHDNFFELGGDSILTIQVISRAQKEGLSLTPKQFFQTPTIEGLANYLTYHATENKIEAEQGSVTGQVPLTPIQHWFFEQNFAEPHHYNQSLFFQVKAPLDANLLQQAIGHLYAHHDALRLRFRRQNGYWEQYHADMIDETPFEWHDLSTASANEQLEFIEAQTNRLQASLDLEQGPLMRVALFDLGAQNGQRLLIVVHHLAVDGVSWRILLEDLQQIYQQLSLGQPIQLPPKTTSYKYWAERLMQLAQTEPLQAEQSYWLSVVNRTVAKLPVDNPAGENLEQSEKNIVVMLSTEETSDLLREVPATYHTQINDILLTALVQAHFRMTGSRSLLIDLEGHGREPLFDEVDLSRTVGWFTSVYPVVLDLKQSHSSGDAVKTIKEQLRQIPQNGIGFGLLRYLSGNQKLMDQLRGMKAAEISFNYLGQFDQVANESRIFDLARESKGHEISPLNKRNYLIDINGSIAGGKLQVEFKYSANLHRRETIERFANHFLSELRAIIAHCKSPDAGGFTPSDFTLAKLNQKKLDKVLQKLNKKKERVG